MELVVGKALMKTPAALALDASKRQTKIKKISRFISSLHEWFAGACKQFIAGAGLECRSIGRHERAVGAFQFNHHGCLGEIVAH
jgi:hypothetical protein